MSQLTTDPAVLAREAANFERISDELKSVIAKVEQVANELESHWQGAAAKAAQGAITRFHEGASAQVQQLNWISTSIQTAASRYAGTDSDQSGPLASAMRLNGERRTSFPDHTIADGQKASITASPSVGSAVSHGSGRGVQMAGHGFKSDAPSPDESAATAQGGTAVHRQPLPMASAPPTAIGPKSDPSKHDPKPGELEEDVGKVAAGIGGDLLLPEAAGVKGPLSIGENLLEGKPPSPGDGLKTATGAFGGFELAKSGLEDAIHANPPAMKPDFIDDWIHGRPRFWEDGTGQPTR